MIEKGKVQTFTKKKSNHKSNTRNCLNESLLLFNSQQRNGIVKIKPNKIDPSNAFHYA